MGELFTPSPKSKETTKQTIVRRLTMQMSRESNQVKEFVNTWADVCSSFQKENIDANSNIIKSKAEKLKVLSVSNVLLSSQCFFKRTQIS